MFEDEVDEVGSDVEAYCPKCKGDTTHVVISKYEDEIRRVQCNPCGDVHSYRKPRGDAEDDVPEPVAARKRAMMKKLTWEEFFAKHDNKEAKPYEFREPYRENHIVFHPKFGKGFVSEVVSESKVEITFADARRVLVHNRKDIAGLPLVAEGDGMPTPPPGKEPKEAKAKGKAKAAPPVLKAAPPVLKAAPPIKAAPPVKAAPPPPPAPVKAKAAAKPVHKSTEKHDKASGHKAKIAKPARAAARSAPKKKAAARKK
ncbi:MAG TPA: hypothetical protein VN914_18955 [Polyangia bacterium]|nr:hypothetical protein [Polyangia bacterium]